VTPLESQKAAVRRHLRKRRNERKDATLSASGSGGSQWLWDDGRVREGTQLFVVPLLRSRI
jgi:hypothetical protein